MEDCIEEKCRESSIIEYEQHEILKQCAACSDVIETNFRYDYICSSYNILKSKGLDLKKLFKFQSKVHMVIYPWNILYSSLRFDVNRLFNIFPLIIVMAKTEEDVIKSFRFARKYKIPISLRSGGHSVEGYSLIQNGMVIDQSRRLGISIHCKKKRVTIESGVLLGPLARSLSEYKLGFVVGNCLNNGTAGYTLNGGLSILSRAHGLGSDNLVSAKLLLADGKIVDVNKKENSDLYFAIRGAGCGQYGILLSMTLKLFPVNQVLYYTIEYPFKDIKEIIKEWIPWIAEAPRSITSSLRNTANKGIIRISGFVLDLDKVKFEKYLSPLLVGSPKITIEKMPFIDAIRVSSVSRWPLFFKTKNAFIKETLSSSALDIIEKYMTIGDENDTILIDGLGGAINDLSPSATAFSHRNFAAWILINARWNNENQIAEKTFWLNSFYQELAPYLSSQIYQNFPGDYVNYLQRYYGENLPRLRDIKEKYDPKNIFSFPQSINKIF